MRTDLTPAEVVRWLRTQAEKLNNTADSIEETFSVGTPIAESPRNGEFTNHSNGREEKPPVKRPATLTTKAVAECMGNRSLRKATIASELGVAEYRLEPILTWENGFKKGERGWYSFIGVPDEQTEFDPKSFDDSET